jgi:flavin-dependent dehydrogenase
MLKIERGLNVMDKQVLIVGGGPAGTACAIELKKRGIASTIIEKDDMPRFHIGESMTGECGASVRKLGFEDIESRMAEDGHPVKWGTIVFGQGGKNSFYIPVMGRDANNELFPQFTWQVRRSSFDKMLFDGAKDLGVNVIKGSALDVIKEGDTITGLKVRVGDEIK